MRHRPNLSLLRREFFRDFQQFYDSPRGTRYSDMYAFEPLALAQLYEQEC